MTDDTEKRTNYRERTGKTSALQIRLTTKEKYELTMAADRVRRSRSSFIVWAALEKAREINGDDQGGND